VLQGNREENLNCKLNVRGEKKKNIYIYTHTHARTHAHTHTRARAREKENVTHALTTYNYIHQLVLIIKQNISITYLM